MSDDIALIFSYHFPPENVIGALRPFRFYKYLSQMGYRCHVISAANVSELPELDAEYVPDVFVTKPRQGVGWQVERVIRRFLLPGVTGSQWAVHAYRAALKFIERNPQARVTIFSTFPPMGPHLAAYWIARQRNLPWIADFRDPVADNPVYEHINNFTKDLYRKAERIFIQAADFAIANTDTAQRKLQTTYPDKAERIQLIWNGFDPEDRLVPLPFSSTERTVVAHVGELYGGRNVAPLLQSMRRLIDGGHLAAESFQIYLAGPIAPDAIPDPQFLGEASAQGWVKLDGERIPQKTAHRIIQTANALLLVQPQTALQVPGKLFEYLQIGRPILAYVPRDSPVERILQKAGVPYVCVYPSNTPEENDRSILEFMRLTCDGARPNAWFETEFNAKSHAGKVAELMELANRQRQSTRQDAIA